MDKTELIDELDVFPSSFNFDKRHLRKKKAEEIIKRLIEDDEATRKQKEEQIKIFNFISFLFSVLENITEALKYCERSLSVDHENLTANVNKGYFLLLNDDLHGARQTVRFLEEIKKRQDFKKKECFAKGDLAYAYSRSGPWYLAKAEKLYKEIIDIYPEEYHWKFGLGLVLVRQTHLNNSLKKNILEKEGDMSLSALDLFLDVTKNTGKSDPILCGFAWVELGGVLYHTRTAGYTKEIQVPGDLFNLNPKGCFEKALNFCPLEPYVENTIDT